MNPPRISSRFPPSGAVKAQRFGIVLLAVLGIGGGKATQRTFLFQYYTCRLSPPCPHVRSHCTLPPAIGYLLHASGLPPHRKSKHDHLQPNPTMTPKEFFEFAKKNDAKQEMLFVK